MTDVVTGPGYELRQGRWQDVLADVTVKPLVCITDPPYSESTAKGQRSFTGRSGGRYESAAKIGYGFITEDDVYALVHWAVDAGALWLVAFGDHLTAELFRVAMNDEREGWRGFSPVPWAKTDAAPRFSCDGPAPQHETIATGRPKRKMREGEMFHRPGWYMGKQARNGIVTGGKPLWLMRALVRHYSMPGDTIVDPYAGGGTTLLAAVLEGRRAIGAEMDPETFRKAAARLERETRDRVYVERPGEAPRMKQQALDLEAAQ
jgi:DNA modification methylase